MENSKVTELETVIPTAVMTDSAPAEQSAPSVVKLKPLSLTTVMQVMQDKTSINLTDYLTEFYNFTEFLVAEGKITPVVKLLLDKGFARHWTEHNSTFSKIPESAKLASIREAFKYWSVGVLTKSAYDSLFKTPAVVSSGKSASVYKTLAARIITMSQSVEVELDHRKHYQKVSDNLIKSGKVAYDAMLAIPTAAHIIKAAEAAILADVPAAPAIDLDFS